MAKTGGPRLTVGPKRRRELRTSLLVGVLCLLVYNINLRSISAGDTYPARYLPFAIWRYHTVLLDPLRSVAAQGRMIRSDAELRRHGGPRVAFWIVQLPGGHAVSLYPLVVPVMVAPLYLPAAVYLQAAGGDQQQLDRMARIMEKVAASLVAAASVALFYLLLRRRTGVRSALVLALAYGFGSTTWVISSQALWQHGMGELLTVCALFLLTAPCTRGRALAAGFVLGLLACNRPPDSILAAALAVYGLWWARRLAPLMVATAVLPVIPLLVYNLGIVGNLAGAYGLIGTPSFLQHDLLSGLAGLLFSPTKGLFVFSPFLLFVPCCVPRLLRDPSTRGLTMAALAAVTLQLLLYGKADWRQGASWGPRWLTDLLPVLIWMLSPLLDGLGRLGRATFYLFCGAAMAIEAVGAFWYTGASDSRILAVMAGPNQMRAAWDIRNAPFLTELRHPRAPADLATDVRGFLDTLTISYGRLGRQIDMAGWALASKRTPWEVSVLLDGGPAASATTFFERPDVTSTVGARGPSGWQVTIPANKLDAGEHVVAVVARPYQGTDPRLLAERRFVIATRDLAASARRAAEVLASHQGQAGYWLTAHTRGQQFEGPHPELNTYLNAMMVDVLAPVAQAAGVQPALQGARRFLAGQIESDGLVRYHGRPDAPTIGSLGCAITPDADDTALVWRIAPGDRPELLAAALRTLAAFRNPDGLYRTWLAPQNRYQCINPGQDPDPADAGIQMHVFMLLAKANPPKARALCASLRRAIDDSRIWVYYKSAPLVPILRQADLQAEGCSLQLPPARQQTVVPGQQPWITAAQQLARLQGVGGPPPARAEILELLRTLAEDDFAYLRHSPPLLYHNDETASLPRFYWSEDFGYALWLRLYLEDARRAAGGAQ